MNTTDVARKRFARVREVYLAAIRLPEDERERYIASASRGDLGIEREVRDLLAQVVPGDESMDALIAGVAHGVADTLTNEANPGTVGPYRVLNPIGRGGMGQVWLAERADGHFEQQVAIKIVDRNRSTPELVARFRGERQILASLDHPNIARLLDGGETGDGVPYLVMDYVDGLPIDRYCDERGLTIRDRLELFLDVCAAIEYAHRNLVVHRDIKPSNILVTQDGMPKLLDFGIAKLMGPQPFDYTVAMTAADHRVLTPRNASPEQIRGRTVTTATDIYSLGLLLYQLLTGCYPYVTRGTETYELERLICESEPTRPSAVVKHAFATVGPSPPSAAQLRRQLKGDLDTIVMVAMRKEPERRYATVRQLAEDVQNYLEHRPIDARGDSLGYRSGKFVRRNPGGVALAGGAVLLIAVLIASYTHRLSVERDRAALEAAKAREVTHFMTELFKAADPRQSTGEAVTVDDILAHGAERVRRDMSGQPALKASLMATIGESYLNMWELSAARTQLADALDRLGPRLGDGHPDVIRMRRVLGMAMSFQGDYEEALELHRKNRELLLESESPESLEVARELEQIGFILEALGEHDAGEAAYREAIDVFRALGETGRAGLASALMGYGSLLRKLGRLEEDSALQLEALAIRRDLYGERHPDYVAVLNNVANSYHARNELETAARYMEENIRLSREIYGADAIPYGVALGNYASLSHTRGDYEKAMELNREVVPIYRRGYGDDHPRYAYVHENMADALEQLGDYENAERYFLKAMDILTARFGADHLEVAITRSRYGSVLSVLGRHDEAVEQTSRALTSMLAEFGEVHTRTLFTRNQLGMALAGAGRDEEGIEIIAAGLTATAAEPETVPYDRVHAMKALADIHRDNGDLDTSLRHLATAIAAWEVMGAAQHPQLAFLDTAYAEVLAAQGESERAAAHLRGRIEAFDLAFGPDGDESSALREMLDAIQAVGDAG